MPLNLFHNLPVFQLEIGKTPILPFVNASRLGVMDLEDDVLVITDCVCEGKWTYKVSNEVLRMTENI